MLKLVDELALEPEFDGASAGERTVGPMAGRRRCERELDVELVGRRVTYRTVKAREIVRQLA